MDRIRPNMKSHPTIVASVKYGEYGSCAIDQQPVQKFNIDPATGRPMDVMTSVLKSKGLEQQRLLSELQEFKADFLPDGISDTEALKYYKPRLCQLPSELAEYSEALTQQQLEKAEKDKKAAEQTDFLKKLDELEKGSQDKDKDKDSN